MFYLVFEYKPKHRNTAYNPWRRSTGTVNRSSTHNQLELDVIRKSIKTRWTCHGFGTAPFQTSIWGAENVVYGQNTAKENRLHHNMNGHIITVEDVTEVIWFRLNFENVSKNGCVLTEIYQDLDFTVLDPMIAEISKLGSERDALQRVCRNVENYGYHLGNVESREPHFMQLPEGNSFVNFKHDITQFCSDLRGSLGTHEALISQKGTEFFDLLATKCTIVD